MNTVMPRKENILEIKRPEQNLNRKAIWGSFLSAVAKGCDYVLYWEATIVNAIREDYCADGYSAT